MSHIQTRLCLSTAMGLLIVLGLAPFAKAQEDATASSETLATISVTSDKPTSPAGAAAVTTVGAEDLAKKQPATVADALKDVPGVSVTRAGNLLNSNISIRNFGGNASMPNDQRVGFVLDGITTAGGNFYRNAAGQIVDPSILRSVSVFKGPLATLQYGSGFVGGVVAMETINGSDLTGDKPGVKLRQVVGANSNGDGWKTSTTLAWQPNESFDLLASYSRSYSDNQKDGRGDTINLGGYNVPSYLLKARYRFGEARDQSITFGYEKSESVEQGAPFAVSSIISGFGTVNRERSGHVASVAYAWQPADRPLIDFELKYAQSRQHFHVQSLGGFSASFAGDYRVDTDTLSLTNTARFSTGSVGHVLRGGIEISHQDHDGVMTGVSGAGKYDRQALFAIDQMDFGHALSVSAGARIEHQRLSDLESTTKAALPDMGTVAHSGGLGFEKGIGGGFTAYGSFAYGEGLTLPEYAGYLPSTDPVYWGNKVFKSRNWEAGVKYQGSDLFAAGDGLTASVGLYRTEIWDDTSYPSTRPYYDQLRTSGLEASAEYRMSNGFYAGASVTKTFNDNKRTASTDWVAYEYALMDQAALRIGKSWDNGFDLRWTIRGGAGQTIGTLHQPGWGVNDVAASYTVQSGSLEGLRVDFGVDNIFDRYYVTQYTTTAASYPEAGRNFKITFSKTF